MIHARCWSTLPFHTVWCNVIKMHETLSLQWPLSQTLWSMDDLCEKMDAVAPKPGKRSPYKKRVAVTL